MGKMNKFEIELPDEEYNWLINESEDEKRKVYKEILKVIKAKQEEKKQNFHNILDQTFGIWKDKDIDGLEYVNKLRDEWERDDR